MEYLTSNLQIAYPVADTTAVAYDVEAWLADASRNGSGSAATQYPTALLADLAITADTTVTAATLEQVVCQEGRCWVIVKVTTPQGYFLWRSPETATIPATARWFVTSTTAACLFTPTNPSDWPSSRQRGNVRVKVVLSAAFLRRWSALAGTVRVIRTATLEPRCVTAQPQHDPFSFHIFDPTREGGWTNPSNRTSPFIRGAVKLIAGNNIRLGAVGNRVTVSAGSGFGAGALPCNPESNAPKGISVGAAGNLGIELDACHTLVPHVPSQTLYLFGNCSSCCSCNDYANFFKALKKFGERWTAAWDVLDGVSTRYLDAKARYDMLRKREEAVTAKLTGSVARGVYAASTTGYPQWSVHGVTAAPLSGTVPVTIRSVLTLHNPSSRWFDGNGQVVSAATRKYMKNLKLHLFPGSLSTFVPSRITETWSTLTKTDVANNKALAYTEDGSGGYFFTPFADGYDGSNKLELVPCAVIDITVQGHLTITTGTGADALWRLLYLRYTWDIEVEGDGNGDGLPDIADADIEAGGALKHATSAALTLEVQ